MNKRLKKIIKAFILTLKILASSMTLSCIFYVASEFSVIWSYILLIIFTFIMAYYIVG